MGNEDNDGLFILTLSVLWIVCSPFFLLLYMMVNFRCPVDWDGGGVQISGWTLFLGVSARVFPEEVSI